MTAQASERIILDGEEQAMMFCPRIPWPHPRIIQTEFIQQTILDRLTGFIRKKRYEYAASEGNRTAEKRLYKEFRDGCMGATNCYRGYIGTWEIKDNRLYLVDILGDIELVGEKPLFADWFTGTLRVGQGEMLTYVHMAFHSVYDRELFIKVEKGVVTKRRVLDNRVETVDRSGLIEASFTGTEPRYPGDDDW